MREEEKKYEEEDKKPLKNFSLFFKFRIFLCCAVEYYF